MLCRNIKFYNFIISFKDRRSEEIRLVNNTNYVIDNFSGCAIDKINKLSLRAAAL